MSEPAVIDGPAIGAPMTIGGSRAAACLGVSPYQTPVEAYLRILGEVEDDLANVEHIYWGNQLEDILANEYAKREDCKVRRRNAAIVHPEHKWMVAHIDRERIGSKRVVEIKTGSEYMSHKWGEPGSDQIPDEYNLQVHHYMALGGYQGADVGVLLGGNKFRIYHIERDDALIEMMQRKLVEFWQNHILPKVPPAPVSDNDLSLLYPQDLTESKLVDGDWVWETLQEIKALDHKIKGYGIDRDLKARTIKAYMEDASALVNDEGKTLATWKAPKPSRVFNMDLFKEENKALHKQYLEERPNSRRFLVK
jgi:putative phage-type endonuclease